MSDDTNQPFIVTSPTGDPLAMTSQDEVVKAGVLLAYELATHSGDFQAIDDVLWKHRRIHGDEFFGLIMHGALVIFAQQILEPALQVADIARMPLRAEFAKALQNLGGPA